MRHHLKYSAAQPTLGSGYISLNNRQRADKNVQGATSELAHARVIRAQIRTPAFQGVPLNRLNGVSTKSRTPEVNDLGLYLL